MDRILIDALSGRTRTALKENGELTEIIYEDRENAVGNIYVGRVAKVLRGQFVFVDIGLEKNAFLQPDINKEPCIFDEKGRLRLKEGDSLAVQVIKAAVDEKGAVVTTRLSLTGKYSVVIVNDRGIGISRKIADAERRSELKTMAEALLPENCALIMRTECRDIENETIESELKELYARAEELRTRAELVRPPSLIYKELTQSEKLVRDLAVGRDTEVIVNSEALALELKERTGCRNIIVYNEAVPLFSQYSVESGIERALQKRVWLKSGGCLVFDYTEAMNVIDVNSGKFTGKSVKDFALKVNLEAAKEAARQIRLRNLSGMIVIDFIDMPDREAVDKISSCLRERLSSDRTTTALVGMTDLGLMQLTRKKIGLPLHKVLMESCPACGGTGMAENKYYITSKIINQIITLFSQTIYKRVRVRGGKALISALKESLPQLRVIEERFNGEIILEEIKTAKSYYYEIDKDRL